MANKDNKGMGHGAAVADQARDFAATTVERGKEFASTVADKAKDTASNLAANASHMASNVASTASNMASTVAEKTGQAASFVGHKAKDATTAVGGGMESLADTIREHTPNSGVLGNAGAAMADTLESGGRYLQEHGLKGIGDDLTNVIRRNPVPALLIGIGIGFLIARATRS